MTERDRRILRRALKDWAATGDFVGLRTRAMVELALSSALRLKECCALDLNQILEDPSSERIAIRTIAYLRAPQSKGARRGQHQWDSAGSFVLAAAARAALRRYVGELKKRGWVSWPPNGPLFLGLKGQSGAAGHARLSRRAAQNQFLRLQRALGIAEPYMFHELRYDALSRFAAAAEGNPFRVAAYGRCGIRTAERYVHTSPITLAQLAELAAKSSA